MSSLDDLVGRYIDEVADFFPVSSAISFVLGVSILGARKSADGHGLLATLLQDYGELWYFRDALFGLATWKILILVILSLSGPFIAKAISRAFQRAGMKGIKSEASRVFSRAAAISSSGGEISTPLTEAAHQWRAAREKSAMSAFKIASFGFSMSLILLFSFISTIDWFDLAMVALLAMAGGYASWKFSIRFFMGCLPERILRDASLGLVEPRLFEED